MMKLFRLVIFLRRKATNKYKYSEIEKKHKHKGNIFKTHFIMKYILKKSVWVCGRMCVLAARGACVSARGPCVCGCAWGPAWVSGWVCAYGCGCCAWACGWLRDMDEKTTANSGHTGGASHVHMTCDSAFLALYFCSQRSREQSRQGVSPPARPSAAPRRSP